MKKLLFFGLAILAVAAVLVILSPGENSNPRSTSQTGSGSEEDVEVLAQDLQIPWAIDFLPNNEILFTERPGNLKLLKGKELTNVATIDEVLVTGEGGLLGVAVDPDYAENNFIYLYYTYQASGNNTRNKVVRYKLVNSTLEEDKTLLENIPGAIFHNGGRLKFGPDDFLYITTGDSLNPSLSQNRNSLAGKILRITRDGSPAPNNPFDTTVYSYGHRNPQGLTWQENRLFSTEHGSSANDEVNVIVRGGNFGWPQAQGDEEASGIISPLTHSGADTWAPGGIASVNDTLYFGGLRGEALFELKQSGSNAIVTRHFLNQYGRIRDVVKGPDNFLYITTSNQDGRGNVNPGDDKIIRINPSKL